MALLRPNPVRSSRRAAQNTFPGGPAAPHRRGSARRKDLPNAARLLQTDELVSQTSHRLVATYLLLRSVHPARPSTAGHPLLRTAPTRPSLPARGTGVPL